MPLFLSLSLSYAPQLCARCVLLLPYDDTLSIYATLLVSADILFGKTDLFPSPFLPPHSTMPPIEDDGSSLGSGALSGADTGGFTDVNDGERPRPSISIDGTL